VHRKNSKTTALRRKKTLNTLITGIEEGGEGELEKERHTPTSLFFMLRSASDFSLFLVFSTVFFAFVSISDLASPFIPCN
jgi:hypothetical protein